MTDATPTPDPLERLREPFGQEQIGKLPRVTCRDCSQSRTKVCDRHAKAECPTCSNYMTRAHIHLDYVGHAEVTDRLLQADPAWEWDFLSRDIDPSALAAISASPQGIQSGLLLTLLDNSPPHFERNTSGQPIGLWITLTVGGVTRKGFGSVEPGKFDPEKQLIGDALRNAAMRFGVALTLWSKGLLESEAHVDEPLAAGEDQRPWWEQWGYADGDEAASVSESLKAILDAIPTERRDNIRSWLIGSGYSKTDETGRVQVMPLPVRKSDVETYRRMLLKARDGSADSSSDANETAPDAPSSPATGGDGGTDREASPEEETQSSAVPPDVVDTIISEVKLMRVSELQEELAKRNQATAGNKDTLGARLTSTLVEEWKAKPA